MSPADVDTTAAQPAAVWVIEVEAGSAEYRPPMALDFSRLPPMARVAGGTVIRSRSSGTTLRVKHVTRNVRISGERTFRLPADASHANSWFRRVGDPLQIQKIPTEFTSEMDLWHKVLSFMTMRTQVPLTRVSAEIRERYKRYPIRPYSPPPVEIVETDYLPTTITVTWPVTDGPRDPHKVFLWRKDQMIYTPHTVGYEGRATIQLREYGHYFWQIEDHTGLYVSIPRTLFVAPKSHVKQTQQQKGTGEGAQDIALVRLRDLDEDTVFFNCFQDGNARVPVVIRHENPEILQYVIFDLTKNQEVGRVDASAVSAETRTSVLHTSHGTWYYRVAGFDTLTRGPDTSPVALSNRLAIRVENQCEDPVTFMSSRYLKSDGTLSEKGKVQFLVPER